MNTPLFVEEFLDVNVLEVNSERGTAKTSDAEGIRFATVPQIGKSGVPQVRVGVIRRSCNAINKQSYAFSCNPRIIVHVRVKLHSASPRAIT